MCLAIFKPSNQTIPVEFLRSGYKMNPHGAGYAYSESGHLHLHKGFFSFAEFWEHYAAHVKPENPSIIHFRAATSGNINEFNCHPWSINDDYALIHNGIFSGFGNKNVSDTGEFTAAVVSPFFNSLKPDVDINSTWVRYLMRAAIGGFNKVVILGKNGNFGIYNEFTGHRINSFGEELTHHNSSPVERLEQPWYSNDYFIDHGLLRALRSKKKSKGTSKGKNTSSKDFVNLVLPTDLPEEHENASDVAVSVAANIVGSSYK